ncbi:hypothetical protein DM02DRAFT_625936 [Periconia macrospinosa]|uniref:Uncharacterized protein n=1 Tax=Periconia macrospinosa TaxID=97972 RepID=A0A2V1DZH6_9PLEO|nr:hypothetical protein DM02DRAFT_625936 [Periconia macrospinosa]
MRFSVLTIGSLLVLGNNIGVQSRAIATDLAISASMGAGVVESFSDGTLDMPPVEALETDFAEDDSDFSDDEILERGLGPNVKTSQGPNSQTSPGQESNSKTPSRPQARQIYKIAKSPSRNPQTSPGQGPNLRTSSGH